ncbi:MAG: YqcI/YcgG family protein [Alicyclobacillus sp.]|nr:YqcI/YcgG family protein [Alicyclobacillus sp.]
MSAPILLTSQDILSNQEVPEWLSREYAVFRSKVLDDEFPCYFGTAAERTGHLRYTYVDEDWSYLPLTLSTFLELSRSHPETRHALVLFVKPETPKQSLDYYNKQFWSILQWLHDNDPVPWPKEIPIDPEDPHWEFCFDGEPMFVFSSAPAYKQRKSRNLGECLVLLFQPRRVFHGIEGGTVAGTIARQKIRDRMLKYDGMPHHPDMGSYGDPSSFEWKQYFLPDDNTPVKRKCPLHLRWESNYVETAVTKEEE